MQNKANIKLKLVGIFPLLLVAVILYVSESESQLFAEHSPDKLTEMALDSAHWQNSIPCLSCHVLHSAPGAQLTLVEGNANLCMSCHNPVGMASNTPFSNADIAEPGVSGTSHAWNKAATNTIYGANFPTNPFMADKVMDGEIVCSTCHEPHFESYAPFLRTSNEQDAMCKNCHSVRNVGIYSTNPFVNLGSHPVGIVYEVTDTRLEPTPTDPDIHLIGSNVECSSCHKLHYANTNDGYLLKATNDDNLCQSCHTYRSHQSMGCTSCHQPHNPNRTNIYMIRDTVPTPNSGLQTVAFTAQAGSNSFADGDAIYDGICEVCHTTTNYHRNDNGGNHTHNMALNCTSCHSHQDAFAPGNCLDCHSTPQGFRRQIVGIGGDFLKASHHVTGNVENSDCVVCHSMSTHQSGTVRLLDPDQGPALVYDYDPANPENIENFCINCHDDDGAVAGNGQTPFSDGQTVPDIKMGTVWDNSAHNTIGYSQNSGNPVSCFGNGTTTGCHGNAHGSDNIKMLSAPLGQSLSDFCFNCHTEGLITNNALAGGVNDIEEAFGQSRHHNLGAGFTESGNNFTLECTSCHNPHIVTGKHWDVASGVSPVTRPDFSDPVNNPRAMGGVLWGDEPGEKMQDFAARASGTGGFYRKTAEGYTLGATGLPADQPAYYTPPKTGAGFAFEFEGDVLPDYTTLCLDCHSYQMSASVGPVNWGQGIPTGHPEPPGPGYVNWVATSSPHGLNSANTSSYISDAGTAGSWGSSGNPDVLFDMNYVTRGRHNGHFMRWPYESADRGAGINFVLSCTDCHEAHGSGVSSMIRSTVNNGSGTPNWNTMCNNCHYYYGGQHAGMSCGTASCHEANSIHRIKKNGGGGSTQLMLTAIGEEGNFIPPDFTPEIVSVTGNIGSNNLIVTFRASQYGTGQSGIYSNQNLTGALQPNDFWLFDKGKNNPRIITGVTHTAGDLTATVIMSAPLIAADLGVDAIATTGNTIWGWYEGGYNNWATGVVPAQEISAGPWPLAIGTLDKLVKGEGAVSYNQVYVGFSSAVYANTDATGNLQPADFVLTDTDNSRTVIGVEHIAGDNTARLTLSSAFDGSNDLNIDEIGVAANSVYSAGGYPFGTAPIVITTMPLPSILSVEGAVGSADLQLKFSTSVFTNSNQTGALQLSDFVLTDIDNFRTISSITHLAGANNAIFTLSSALDNSDDIGVEELAAATASVFDADGYPVDNTPLIIAGQVADSIVAVTGTIGYDKLEVRFSGAVYANPGKAGTLQPADFVLTDADDSRTIIGVDHTLGVENYEGEDIAWLTLSSVLDDTDDINVDMLAVPDAYNYLDNLIDTNPVVIGGMPATVIDSVEGNVGSSILKVTFSHWVFANADATGNLEPADFVLTDVNSDNARTITTVQHTAGNAVALLTMSTPLIAADIDNDLLEAAVVSIFNSAAHPVPTTPGTVRARTAPQITMVEGTAGVDKLLVFFTEGVYTGTGRLGALQATDFTLTDSDNGRTILSVEHEAGTSAAILTLSAALDGSNDIGVDALATVSNEIFNGTDDPAGTGSLTVTGNNCPVGGTRFNFGEPAESASVTDDTGLLIGTVGNPTFSMLGNGLYTGDPTEAEMTYIDVDNTNVCLKTPRALTLESKFYMSDIDLDYVDLMPENNIDDDYDAGGLFSRDGDGRNTTATRIAERKRTFQFTIMRSNWSGDEIESRAETGRVIFKYRVTDRGYCDGSYPGDPTIGDGAWWKQISSDDAFSLITGHWYIVRIVFNTDKQRLAVDIFADDLGTDGSGTGELWLGYKNITQSDPEASAGCKWAAIPGLIMETEDQYLYIGDNFNHIRPGQDDQGDYRNVMLKGNIDWFSWKPVADYTGVDDPPY